MEKKQVNFWISIGANIGVIVGLALLVYELNQTSTLTRLQLEQERYAMFLQTEVSLFGDRGADILVKSVLEPSELTAAEMRIADAYLGVAINRSYKVYQMEMAGFYEEGYSRTYMESNLPYDFGNEYALAWWSHERELWKIDTEQFALTAGAVIEGVDPNYSKNRIASMQSRFAP